MSEYIGSHISLISKSDIRYIGTLHEINSESSTVALENVKSYGTEGRRGNPTDEIPGSDQVYEYIVFRGSDVKELSIVEAPKESKAPAVPNDPAILGSARPQQPQQGAPPPPPQQQQQQQPPFQQGPPHFQPPYDFQHGPPPPHFQGPPPPRFQNAGGPHGFPGQPGSVPAFNHGFGGPPPNFGYGPPGPGFPNAPGPYNQQQQAPIAPPIQQQQQQQQQQRQPPGKPDHLQQIRSDVTQRPAEMSATPTPVTAQQNAPPPPLDSKPTNVAARSAANQAAAMTSDPKSAAKKATNTRVAVPLPATSSKVPPKPNAAKQPSAKPQSYADATQAATAAVAAAMAQLNPSSSQASSGVDNLTQKVNQMRVQDAGLHQRGRGRGRGATGTLRGGRREQRGVDVPKEDFDFASSNAKFNKQDLVKEAIATGSPVPSPAADSENTNGLENGNHADVAEADDVVIPPKPSAEKTYDKKTSFFDNLSSDLRDRAAKQDVDGRALRNQERNKNVETFGQGSVDSGRGGFRGRGRGRGFGRGRGSVGAGYAARGAYNAAASVSASNDEAKGRNRGVAA